MKKIRKFSIISILVISLTSPAFASIDKNLKYGQRDLEVTELQEFLIDKGMLISTPSTFFGLLTLKAVKAYQISIGISPTGFVGILTREKINKEINTGVVSSNKIEKTELTIVATTSQKNIQDTNSATIPNSNDSIYDINQKIDNLGRNIIITQDPNYKFLNIVRAKVDVLGSTTLIGFFYKDTKTFLTDEDISAQQYIIQEQIKKKSAPPVIDSTTTKSQTQYDSQTTEPKPIYEVILRQVEIPTAERKSERHTRVMSKIRSLLPGMPLVFIYCEQEMNVSILKLDTLGTGKCIGDTYYYDLFIDPGVYYFKVENSYRKINQKIELYIK